MLKNFECVCSGYQLLHIGCKCKEYRSKCSEALDYIIENKLYKKDRWECVSRALKILEAHFIKDKNDKN